MDTDKVSIVIPARNEVYLGKTIKDILTKAGGNIEVIAVLDGYWPDPKLVSDERLIQIYNGSPLGMRACINLGVEASTGKYILKSDGHCMFEKNFDQVLKKDCEKNWVVIPRRYALDPINWRLLDNPKYPVDYMYLSPDLHGEVWNEKNKDPNLKSKVIDDTMSAQGSCWFMEKSYFHELELEDEENYGEFSNEFQEIGFKCWLSGGRVVVNKSTWYAHWHKTEGRGYSMGKGVLEKGVEYTKRWPGNTAWHKQTRPFSWLIEKFSPVPGWPENKV